MNKNLFFETIKCQDGSIFNLDYHKNRMAKTIGKNFNLEEYIYPPNDKLLRCKIIYNQDEIISVEYFDYMRKNISTFEIINDDSIAYQFKFLNRDIFDNYSNKSCADEIIFFKNGFLTDTTIANIAILVDDIWYTPRSPLLMGTTRKRYLDEKCLVEKDIDLNFLQKANKIALLNAMVDFYELDDFNIITKD